MSWPTPIRVVGIGSSQGDDASAWEVVRRLRERIPATAAIEWHLVDGGQRLLDCLDGTGTLLLIDAVASGSLPGTLHRFGWPEGRLETLRPGSTHNFRPAEALQLAESLALLPLLVVVFGIEIGTIEPAHGLSPPVEGAVTELMRRIAAELI
jgi:hydrogenase maturation protease